MTTTTAPVTPTTAAVWIRTAKGVQTWNSPIGPVVVFKEGAYWYDETPTRKVERRGGRDRRPVHYSGTTTAEGAKSIAVGHVGYEVARRVREHNATPAFPFVVGQRVSCSFGVATVVVADRAGWIEVVWDNGTANTGDEFDASEFNPA